MSLSGKNQALAAKPVVDGERDPRRLLGFRLPLLANTWTALSARSFSKGFGLKQAEARVLFVIGINGAASLKYIGQAAGIEKAYASRTIAALVKMGLVIKTVDEGDRRSVRLVLSEKGVDLHQSILEDSIARDDDWISVLKPSERQNLHDYLDRLAGKARELSGRKRS